MWERDNSVSVKLRKCQQHRDMTSGRQNNIIGGDGQSFCVAQHSIGIKMIKCPANHFIPLVADIKPSRYCACFKFTLWNQTKRTCFRIGFTWKVTIFVLQKSIHLNYIYSIVFSNIFSNTNNKHKYFLFLIFKLFCLFIFLLTNNIKHGVGSINLYKESQVKEKKR